MGMLVTMIRLHVPESSHSAHRAQMEKILHFLGAELHVRGLSVSMGRREAGAPPPQRYEGVGDLLRGSSIRPESSSSSTNRQRRSKFAANSASWRRTVTSSHGRPSGRRRSPKGARDRQRRAAHDPPLERARQPSKGRPIWQSSTSTLAANYCPELRARLGPA